MALNLKGLFGQENQYADDGSLIIAGTQEYAAKYKTQIYAWAQETSATTWKTIYTVPAGSVLFISYAQLTCQTTTAATSMTLRVNGGAAGDTILSRPGLAADSNYAERQAFTMPIKVTAGELVTVYNSNADSITTGYIWGWLEDA